jgi:hypothetical protein
MAMEIDQEINAKNQGRPYLFFRLIHPNNAGYRIIAESFSEAMASIKTQ